LNFREGGGALLSRSVEGEAGGGDTLPGLTDISQSQGKTSENAHLEIELNGPEQQIERERRRVRALVEKPDGDMERDAGGQEREFREAAESDLCCRVVEEFSIAVHERVSPDEALQALLTLVFSSRSLLTL
jgi:hypothetical protein